MINLVSGFILVLISNFNSMTTVNNPSNDWLYDSLENCKEAGSYASSQSRYVYYVCVPSAYETEKND